MTDQANLDALLVRNIGDLCAAITHSANVVRPKLWAEAGAAAKGAVRDDTWVVEVDAEEEDVWLAKRAWIMAGKDVIEDFWLGLDERDAPGGEGEESWIATFTGSGPNGASLALWVDQRILTAAGWKRVLRANGEAVDRLRSLGFRFDEQDDMRLYLPVAIDRETLAKAFEEDDFDAAMQPLVDAVGVAIRAVDALDALRELAKAAA